MAEDVKISEEVPSKRRRLDPDSTSDDCGISNTSTYDSPTLVHGPLSYRNEDLANSSGLVNSNCDGVDECSRASIAEGSTTEDNLDQNHSANVVDVGGAEGGDNMSDVTDVSDISGHSEDIWQTMSPGSMMWVQDQIMTGISPRIILNDLIPSDVLIPDDIDDFTLCKIIVSVMSEPPRRKKLVIFNTLDDVLHLLRTCSNIMVLTGAGVSVSCGIPDFRSRNGIYARLAVDFPDLPDPHSMFDIKYFRDDPRPFFKFAKEIYPGQFEPSKSHKFIKLLEDRNKLLRNYTQNIDTLEQVAGIRNVIQCHGSFANATCMICKQKMTADDIKEDIFKQVIPRCPKCPPDDAMAVMKPDIVFFGESLPEEFHQQMATDKDKCDLLVVIGSSLKVRPVALIPNSIPPDVPQILINREPLKNMDFDVELLGDCDTIVTELCKRLEWEGLSCLSEQLMEEVTKGQLKTPPPYTTHDNVFPVVADSCEGRAGSEQQSVMAHQQVGAQVCNSSQNQSNGDKVTPSGQSSEFGVGTTASNGHIRSDNASIQTLQENICSSVCIAEETSVVSCPSVRHSVSSVTEKNMVEPDTSEVVGTEQNCIASSPTSQSAVISHVITESIVSNDEPVSSVRAINNGPREADEENGTNAVGVGLPGSSCATDDNSELEMILRMWQPKRRDSLSKRLEENQYLYLAPSRYVFPGAEVYDSCCSDDDEDDRKSLSSSPSSFSSHDSRVIEVDTADHMDNGECDPFPSTGHVSKCDQGEDVSKCDQGEDVSKCDQGEDVSKCDQGEDVSKCDQGEDVSKCDQGEDVSKCDQGEDVSKCDQGEDVSKCDQGEDVSKCDKPEDCCHVSKCDKPEDCCHVSKCNQGEDVSICDQGEDVSKCNQPEDVSKCDKPEDCCHVSKCDQPEECQSDTQVSTSLPLCEENLLC